MFEVKVHTGSECQWRNIVPLQPEGFKGQSPDELEALKQSITQNGFHDAFDVWQHNNTLFSIDGVHRKIALLALESEGVQIPETLPCTYIQAKDKKEATLILMSRNITYSHIVSTAALFDAVAMDAEVMLPIVPEKQKDLFEPILEIDYSILDDEDADTLLQEMADGVKKAIQIEFEPEHYAEAYALVKFWREQDAYVGKMILDFLKAEKNKL